MNENVSKPKELEIHSGPNKLDAGGCEIHENHGINQILPPDGGWGWVVVLASFLCNVVVDGIIFTAGMLFPTLTSVYGASYSQVAWISSLLGGFYLLAGPFVSSIANAFGFRTVCILGSIVSAISCGASFYATSLPYLYISFGIVTGIGFGCIYVPAVIATGFYFDKRRAFATGIGVCGSGIGTFVFPPLILFMLDNPKIDWKYIFIAYSVSTLSCAIFGLAFRPLSSLTGKVLTIDEKNNVENPINTSDKQANDHNKFTQFGSAMSMSPTIIRAADKIEKNDIEKGSGKEELKSNVVTKTPPERYSTPDFFKRLSVPAVYAVDPTTQANMKLSNAHSKGKKPVRNSLAVPGLEKTHGQVRYSKIASAPHLAGMDTQRRHSRQLLGITHPFNREDAFYSGSLARIPQYKQSLESLDYHTSMNGITVLEDESRTCTMAACSVFRKIFDFSLLSSMTFVVLAISGFMAVFSLFVPFSFITTYTTSIGISPKDRASILSVIGIFNTIGRLVAGWISDHPQVDALMVNNLALIIGGTATCCLPFITNIYILYSYSVIFGLSVAAFASLRSILLVELLGLEKLTNSFGLLLLFQGIAGTFGGPVAGLFIDLSGSFSLTFVVFGGIFALSGVICIPLRRIKKWEEGKNNR